ncbi:MAG: BlaI/MecI/CopY family transcriptional regulator [Terriglobia bacterium]
MRDVYETLLKRRGIAYTTVMTMMGILEEKGYLKKRAAQRAYVYRAARPKSQVIRAMVRDFVDRVFNGSAEPLLVQLVKDRRLSPKDLEKIARMIQEKTEC